MATVVVGVDGSRHATHALEQAVEEARLRGATLRVVHVEHHQLAAGFEIVATHRVSSGDVHADAVKVLEQAVASVPDDVEVVPVLARGKASAVLLAQAEGADLLVVASHGTGGTADRVLGSTASAIVGDAPCAVLVVPPAPSPS